MNEKINSKEHYKKHSEYQRSYRELHREEIRQKAYERWHKNNDFALKQKKLSDLRVKEEILKYYGNGKLACICCGFSNIDALTIDHINGGGAAHRKSLTGKGGFGGKDFYRWLKMNDYPMGYQTLCMNCQFIKKMDTSHEDRRNVLE